MPKNAGDTYFNKYRCMWLAKSQLRLKKSTSDVPGVTVVVTSVVVVVYSPVYVNVVVVLVAVQLKTI